MARNKLAGKINGKGKSSKHYAENPESKKKKDEYNKKYGASLARKLYRSFLNAKGGGTVLESQSKNRARNRGKK